MVPEESVSRTIAVMIAATMLTTAAVAQNRPSTTAMTCQQAASLVYARGAIVLGTGGYTYDRFVRDRSFCQVTEALESAWVPTRDTPTCFVGYRCYEPSRDDRFRQGSRHCPWLRRARLGIGPPLTTEADASVVHGSRVGPH